MPMRPEFRWSVVAVMAVAGTAVLTKLVGGLLSPAAAAPPGDPYASYRARTSVPLPMTTRDFNPSHPDFAGTAAGGGAGRYAKIPADALDSAGRPVFSSTGYRVATDWHDSAGRPIIAPRPYIKAAAGDVAGSMSTSPGGAVSAAAAFAQWFKPVAGVNAEYRGSIVLNRTGDTYIFDDSLDVFNGRTDFSYTAAVDTTFISDAASNWYIGVGTGAEAFVFIDGKLVIDGGGGLGSDASDPGLPGGHFDVDVYNNATSKQLYHKHQYDDSYDVTYVDLVNDSRLLFSQIIPSNYPNPLHVKFVNKDNGGWGTFNFADTTSQSADWVRAGFDRVFRVADLKQLRVNFRTLALMAHTDPGTSHADVANRAGAFNIQMYDTVSGKLVYELAVYHHGTAPANYQQLRNDYNNHNDVALGGTTGRGMPAMTQRIDLSRLGWLGDGTGHTLKVFFANRTGAASRLHFETNINTLGLAPFPKIHDVD